MHADNPMTTSVPLDKIKVVLLEGVHAHAAEHLAQAGFTVETIAGAPDAHTLDRIADEAHMIGIRSKTNLTETFFARASKLWAVGCFCIGTNQVDLEAAAAQGVAVFNAPFANTRSVAELTIAEIIALHRGLTFRSMRMHRGVWDKSASGSHEIRGRTLGIIGYGRIGSQTSILAEALGMRVVFYDTANVLPLGNAQQRKSIEDVLRESDVVTVHVPETDHTRDLIGRDQLAMMKPGAYLINNARGTVVDLDALAEALQSNRIAGAALDVFPAEPASNAEPFDSPLLGMDEVILTPHIAGSTAEAQRSIADEVAAKLARLMNNGSTTSAVNIPNVELPNLHPDHHRVLHYHHNVPGVLRKLNEATADLGANVTAQFLQSDPKHSYVIMDVDSAKSEPLRDRLAAIEETIKVRILW
jgi:D-3-phosphoglycerate dehydrogenase